MKLAPLVIILFLTLLLLVRDQAAAGSDFLEAEHSSSGNLSHELHTVLGSADAGKMLDVIVVFQSLEQDHPFTPVIPEPRAQRLQRVIHHLQSTAAASQKNAQKLLNGLQQVGQVEKWSELWIINALALRAGPEVIRKLAGLQEVREIRLDTYLQAPELLNAPASVTTTNLSLIQADTMWEMGFFGQGVVVANFDTGVNVAHPGLADRWRGGSNSWFNPYNPDYRMELPYDLAGTISTGHGTASMGIMVGQVSTTQGPGIAPKARWIAAKIFDNSGTATRSAIHQAFQWVLDPDGDPLTADAPHVVSNSWAFTSSGCDLEYQPDLLALRAAGILPIFASGNLYDPNLPGLPSDVSPANNPAAFATGAIDNTSLIAPFSSRGPSICDGQTYPRLTAPGVNEYTTHYSGGYDYLSGTSIAAPHAAGGLALLISAYPDLPVEVQEQALLFSAIDLGATGPDNTYGYGRLALFAAYQWVDRYRFSYRIFMPLVGQEFGVRP